MNKAFANSFTKKAVQKEAFYHGMRKAIHTGKVIDNLRRQNIWKRIEDAVLRGEQSEILKGAKQLKAAAKKMELRGVKEAKALNEASDYLIRHADDIAKISKQTGKDIAGDIRTLKSDLAHSEDFLRRYGRKLKPDTKKLIEERIKLTKKQVATKVREKPILHEWKVAEPGKYLPSKVAATRQLARSKAKIKIGKKSIPIREFTHKPARRVARDHGVELGELVWAVSALPLRTRKQIIVTSPEVEFVPSRKPKDDVAVRPAEKTRLKEKEEAEEKVEPAIRVQPATKVKTIAKPEPIVKPKVKEQPEVLLKAKPSVKVRLKEKPRPKARFRPRPRMRVPKEAKKKEIVVLPGTIEWRQGMFWRYKEPPHYDVLKTSKTPLPGTYKFAVGERSAYKTIQALGGAPPRDFSNIDIGIALVDVKRKGRDLTIKFKQDVEDAYRGKVVTEKVPKPTTAKAIKYKRKDSDRISLIGDPKVVDSKKMSYQPSVVSVSGYRERTRKRKATYADIPDRYYLGHKLRPAELGAVKI